MPCKYYVRDGVPSKLFDSLFSIMKERYNGDEVKAEKEAVRIWSMTRSDNFKNWFGDWEIEVNANNPKLLEEAKSLSGKVNKMYEEYFKQNVKESLRGIAEQINLGHKDSIVKIFGERIADIAIELYPTAKMTDNRIVSKIVDENGEPEIMFHNTNKEFTNYDYNRNMYFTSIDGGHFSDNKHTVISFLNIKKPSFVDAYEITNKVQRLDIIKSGKYLNNDGLIATPEIYLERMKESNIDPNEYKDKLNFPEVLVFNPNQIKSIDNIGYFSTESDDIKAMVTDHYYDASNKRSGNNFFYLSEFDPEMLSGTKNMNIRPENMKSGTYKYGSDYYKITNRGLKKIGELKEKPETVRSRDISKTNTSHIEEFYKNKIPMYVYDIKKLEVKDYPGLAMEADYQGDINIERNPGFTSNTDVFNKYISAISDYISRLYDERKKSKGNLNKVQEYSERITEQEAILKALQGNKSVRFLIETGASQLEIIKQYAMKDDASLIELTEGMRISLAWSQINSIIDLMREGKTEKELEIVDAGRQLQTEADAMFAVLRNRQTERIIELGQQHEIEFNKSQGAWIDENGEVRIRDINAISTNTISSAYSANPVETLVTTLLNARTNKSNDEHYAFIIDADNTAKRLLGSVKPKMDFMTEDYEMEAEGTDGKITKIKQQGIVTEYSRKFYDEYSTLRGKAMNGEIKWKDFYAFEQKHFSYTLTPEGQKEYEDYIEGVRADNVIDMDDNGNYIYDEEVVQAAIKRYNPETFTAHLQDEDIEANSGARWFTKTPKNIPLNSNYQRMTANEKEYHKWFSDQFMDAYVNSIFDYRVGQTDIDQLLLDFSTTMTEGLGNKAKYIGQAGIDFLKDSFTVVATSTKSKAVTRALTGREHIAPVFKAIDDFLPENGGKIHPLEVLKKFKASSIAFKHKREIEEVLNVINDITSTATKQEQNNSGIDVNRNAGGGLGTKNPLNIAKRVEYTVKEFLQGSGKERNTTRKDGVLPGQRGFSVGQTLDSVNKLTRFRYMALSPLSAAGNFLMGAINNFTYAAAGQYFTDSELTRASFMLKSAPFSFFTKNLTLDKVDLQTKEAKMVAELMYKYNILGDVTEELTYGESALSRLFALQKGGEFLVQGATCLAQMLHTKVTFKDGSSKTLLDLYKLNSEGRLEYQDHLLADDSPYKNIENVHLFFDKVKAINDKIHGDYRHALLGKKDVFGRMLFMFRTWLPMSIKERFGAEYEHKLLGTQKGRYRSAFDLLKIVKKDGEGKWEFQKDNALNLAKTFLKLIPFAGKVVKLGGNISEVDRRNIDMFVRETQMLIMLTMATAFAKASVSGDPDDDETNFFKYLYNQGERMQSELSMYYLPSSYNQILKNIVPMTNTLIDAEKVINALAAYISDPEKDLYTRGFRKGDSKLKTRIEQFFPITRSAQSTWSAFSNLYNQNITK
jgi:hypothetical protein